MEATKYTELGFVGRDVEDIIKDLVEASLTLTRQRLKTQLEARAARQAEDKILRALCGEQSPEIVETLR